MSSSMALIKDGQPRPFRLSPGRPILGYSFWILVRRHLAVGATRWMLQLGLGLQSRCKSKELTLITIGLLKHNALHLREYGVQSLFTFEDTILMSIYPSAQILRTRNIHGACWNKSLNPKIMSLSSWTSIRLQSKMH